MWGVALLWCVVIAVWGGLHAFILPRIDEYRPMIEQKAARATGVSVQIGSLQMAGSWWMPWVQANDVRLLDVQGRAALRLPRVVVAVTPWSLLRGSWTQLVIDRPDLDIRRDVQGQLWVAGLPLPASGKDTSATDWFFSQPEFVIQKGAVHWRDELRHGVNGAELTLSQVDVVVRNKHYFHDLRIDMTPPKAFGERLSLRGKFHQTPWHRSGDWQDWSGEAYVDTPWIDLAQLRQWVQLEKGISLQQGRGTLRLWADVRKGLPFGVLADIALDAVDVRLGAELRPLALRQVRGRLGARWQDGEVEFSSQDLMFDTLAGEHWPGGELRVSWRGEDFHSGAVSADRLDLGALAQINERLPLSESWRDALRRLQPQGQLNQLKATWHHTGADQSQVNYSARGYLRQFHVTHDPKAEGILAQLPGLEGVSLDFDVTQQGGKAKLQFQNGSLTLPGGLDEPSLVLDDAAAQLMWQLNGNKIAVQVNQGHVTNPDLAGEFNGSWKTAEGTDRLPGVLDLSATFSHVEMNRVHRYLPNMLPQQVRDYVRNAVQQGDLNEVKLRVRGNLRNAPFTDPKLGEFRVSGQLAHGRYDYVPQQSKTKSQAWPALTDVTGELVFERNGMQFKGSTGVAGASQVLWHKVDARIDDLAHAVVRVGAEAHGPLSEVLSVVAAGSLNELTRKVLEKSQGDGMADYTLSFELPINNLTHAKVQGSVKFQGNNLQAIAGTPVLSRAYGQLLFNEKGFLLKNVKGRMLGGNAELQGGLEFGAVSGDSPIQLRIKGDLTAEGLRQAKELGIVSRLALQAQGRTDYQAMIGVRRGQPELLITSDLKGMALAVPAPLTKPAMAVWPLRVETQLTRDSLAPKTKVLQDQLWVSLGRVLSMNYVRDLTTGDAQVLQGAVAVGQAVSSGVPMRPGNVTLSLQSPSVDLDAWSDVLSQWTGAPMVKAVASHGVSSSAIGGVEAAAGNAKGYVPSSLAVQADEVKVADRTVHHVAGGGSRQGDLWRLNVSADELNGLIELRPATDVQPAQFFARLSYLHVPPSEVSDVENMLSTQPSSIPSLDVMVNDLDLRGRKLGRLEIQAINRAGTTPASREWVLNKLNLTVPEASLTAKGNWAADGPRRRRTQFNFVLTVQNSGQLLSRFGTPNAVREGNGKIDGQLAWSGSPLDLDYPSLSGKLNINIEKGQFLKTDPGAARLLGVLNLQALPRRLTLDFSDIFSDGFAFDFFRGDARIDQGVAYTNNLQMKGVVAGALIEGQADLAHETQDLKVVVVPEINAGTASLYMATINPVIGLTSYLAQLILSRPLVKAGTTEFHVDGTWGNPRVTKVE